MKTFLKVVLWVVIIAAVIFVVLFISARVAGFGNIPALIQYLIDEYYGNHQLAGSVAGAAAGRVRLPL